jgi:hypothetical protein
MATVSYFDKLIYQVHYMNQIPYSGNFKKRRDAKCDRKNMGVFPIKYYLNLKHYFGYHLQTTMHRSNQCLINVSYPPAFFAKCPISLSIFKILSR